MTWPGTLRKGVYPVTTPGLFFTGKIQTWEWIMNEKKEAGLNGSDMKAVTALWIITFDNCEDVDCTGKGGVFKGTVCPLKLKFADTCKYPNMKERAGAAKEWFDKYHQRKAKPAACGNCEYFSLWSSDFDEDMKGSRCVEKGIRVRCGSAGCPEFQPRTEGVSLAAAKEPEQEDKPEPAKSCGNCKKHTLPLSFATDSKRWLVLCSKTGDHVHIDFTGCPDFKPKAESVSIGPDSFAIALDAAKADGKLEKENAELQSTNAHLREELAWQFDQMTKEIGTLQDQNDRLRKELDAAKVAENDSRLFWNKEHERTWQRIKELETELNERNQSSPFTFFGI